MHSVTKLLFGTGPGPFHCKSTDIGPNHLLHSRQISFTHTFTGMPNFMFVHTSYNGRIDLPLNKTLTDDISVKQAINKTFLVFIRSDPFALQFQQVSLKSDKKQKCFINSPFNGYVVTSVKVLLRSF